MTIEMWKEISKEGESRQSCPTWCGTFKNLLLTGIIGWCSTEFPLCMPTFTKLVFLKHWFSLALYDLSATITWPPPNPLDKGESLSYTLVLETGLYLSIIVGKRLWITPHPFNPKSSNFQGSIAPLSIFLSSLPLPPGQDLKNGGKSKYHLETDKSWIWLRMRKSKY